MVRMASMLRGFAVSAVSLVVAASLAGCATNGGGMTSIVPGKGVPPEVTVKSNLALGMSWKSRFTSTSDIRRVLRETGGQETIRSRSVGMELVAVQTVKEVAGKVATIQVDEASVRILQGGAFVEAPFRQFNPPARFTFTVDMSSGKADFKAAEKVFGEWMDGIRKGPIGDVLGRSFRLDDYLAQVRELYTAPFTRFAGKTIVSSPQAVGETELILPFLGPAVSLKPVPVKTTSWIEGVEDLKGETVLKIGGRYAADPATRNDADELGAALSDFGKMQTPTAFDRVVEARGQYSSYVAVASGRELRGGRTFSFKASTKLGESVLSEEISGKTLLEPAE
jgi:hypothetical protein